MDHDFRFKADFFFQKRVRNRSFSVVKRIKCYFFSNFVKVTDRDLVIDRGLDDDLGPDPVDGIAHVHAVTDEIFSQSNLC